MSNIQSFEELIKFLSSKSGLRMAHIYKPVMLLTVIRGGGTHTMAVGVHVRLLDDHEEPGPGPGVATSPAGQEAGR